MAKEKEEQQEKSKKDNMDIAPALNILSVLLFIFMTVFAILGMAEGMAAYMAILFAIVLGVACLLCVIKTSELRIKKHIDEKCDNDKKK